MVDVSTQQQTIAPSGNSVTDLLNGFLGFSKTALDQYSTFTERQAAIDINKAQSAPVPEKTAVPLTPTADFWSDPKKVKNAILTGGAALLTLVLIVKIMRR